MECANRVVFSCIGYQNHYKGTDIVKSILENNPFYRIIPRCCL